MRPDAASGLPAARIPRALPVQPKLPSFQAASPSRWILCEDDATVRVELWKPDRLPVRNFDFESYKAALAREQEGWEAEA